jgi:hypothetical protein
MLSVKEYLLVCLQEEALEVSISKKEIELKNEMLDLLGAFELLQEENILEIDKLFVKEYIDNFLKKQKECSLKQNKKIIRELSKDIQFYVSKSLRFGLFSEYLNKQNKKEIEIRVAKILAFVSFLKEDFLEEEVLEKIKKKKEKIKSFMVYSFKEGCLEKIIE